MVEYRLQEVYQVHTWQIQFLAYILGCIVSAPLLERLNTVTGIVSWCHARAGYLWECRCKNELCSSSQ